MLSAIIVDRLPFVLEVYSTMLQQCNVVNLLFDCKLFCMGIVQQWRYIRGQRITSTRDMSDFRILAHSS